MIAFSSSPVSSASTCLISSVLLTTLSAIGLANVVASDSSVLREISVVRTMAALVFMYQSATSRSLTSGCSVMFLVASAALRAVTSE